MKTTGILPGWYGFDHEQFGLDARLGRIENSWRFSRGRFFAPYANGNRDLVEPHSAVPRVTDSNTCGW